MALSFAARVDARGFDLELELADGERLAVLGPNGAGKSTLLSVLAGTLRPDHGRAELDGQVLFDVSRDHTRQGRHTRWVPPHARRIALLAQEPLLFPNLTVQDNVAFGPRAARRSRADARQIALRWLAEVDAEQLAGRKPGQLSGGQAQRVAVARAIAADPRLLLLDEPLAALDVTAAPMLRRVLRTVLADRAVILVTHDLLDAVLLSDRVIVLDQGRIVESGRTAEVMRHPTAPFTAHLAGLNLISGTVHTAHPARLAPRARRPGRGRRCANPALGRRTRDRRLHPERRLGLPRSAARQSPQPVCGHHLPSSSHAATTYAFAPRPRPGNRWRPTSPRRPSASWTSTPDGPSSTPSRRPP